MNRVLLWYDGALFSFRPCSGSGLLERQLPAHFGGFRLARSVCLQINFAPSDVRYVTQILPHQLRVLGNQVDEIQFTVDDQQRQQSRYGTTNSSEKLTQLTAYLTEVCENWRKAYVTTIDFSPSCLAHVADTFAQGRAIPARAYNGSGFHAYLYGLYCAQSEYILHLDSDMFLGGGSQTWVAEAIDRLEGDRKLFACAPLSGPPRSDGALLTQEAIEADVQHHEYTFQKVSTRVFLLNRLRLASAECKTPLVEVKGARRLVSTLNGMPPYEHLEDCMSAMMSARNLLRLDFLGSGNGLWTLHPGYRSERFYAELPRLVDRIESGEIPDAQRGDYEMNDSMIDWSDARRKKTKWARMGKLLRLALANASVRAAAGWPKPRA